MKQDSDHAAARRALAALAALFLGACDSSSGVVPAPPLPDTSHVDKPEAKPPRLLDVYPERGAWFAPGANVVVTGRTEATTAPVSIVKYLGELITQQGNTFEYSPPVVEGVNIVGLRIEADDEERTVDGRAFFHGNVHEVGATIPQAVHIHLSGAFLDDNNPDLDDVASIAELIITDPELLAGFTEPVDTELAIVTPSEVTIGGADVGVVPSDGELWLTLTAKDVHVAFHLEGKGGLGDLLTGDGTLDADSVEVTLFLALSILDGEVQAEVTNANVFFEGFQVQHEALDKLGTDLSDLLEEFVTERFQELAMTTMGDLVADFLEGFAYETTVGEQVPLNVKLALDGIAVAKHGLNLTMAASVLSGLGQGVPFGPDRGSLKTVSTPPEPNFSPAPVAFIIDDDLINQFMFAYWFGGGTSSLEYKVADFDDVDLSDVPAVFQPLSRIEIDTLLPLTLLPRTLDDDELPFELALGELNLRLISDTGKSFGMSINIRTGIGFELNAAANSLRPLVDARPKFMVLKVGCYEAPPAIDPGSVASLIRLGFPPLLKQGSADFSFAIPALPLGNFVSISALADKQLGFTDLDSKRAGLEGNMLLVEGTPLLETAAPTSIPPGGPE